MGTNYYVDDATPQLPPCPTCQRSYESTQDEPTHIGKISMGWVFLFAPLPGGLETSAKAWLDYLDGKKIKDEYGCPCSLEELKEIIGNSRGRLTGATCPREQYGPYNPDTYEYLDAEGYRISRNGGFS